MAKPNKIPKVKVDILVDDVPLQQYEDEEEDQGSPDKVTKYVEAKSGAEFVVCYKFEETPQYDVRVDVHLDGKYADNKLALLGNFRNSTYQQTMDGAKLIDAEGRWTLAKFSFADLKIGSSPSTENARTLSLSSSRFHQSPLQGSVGQGLERLGSDHSQIHLHHQSEALFTTPASFNKGGRCR